MDFSLDLFPVAHPDRQSGADYFRQSLDLCELADVLGFRRVKVIGTTSMPTAATVLRQLSIWRPSPNAPDTSGW